MSARNSYQILVRCGWTPSEASLISGYKPTQYELDAFRAAENKATAIANEEKYESAPASFEDRISNREDKYVTIKREGVDNGDCTTRRGVYRRHKFGKGNKGFKAWLEEGFEENRK